MTRFPTSDSPVSMVLFSRRNILPAKSKTHPAENLFKADTNTFNVKHVEAAALGLSNFRHVDGKSDLQSNTAYSAHQGK